MFSSCLDTCSSGALSEELAHQAAEMCEGQHPGWYLLHPQLPANKHVGFSALGDRECFPSLTFEVSPTWAARWDSQARQRLELLLGTAHARAMGLELGLRYTEGPAGAEGGVGSSSMKAE